MAYLPTMAEELDSALIEAIDEADREREDTADARLLVLWEFVKGGGA